MKKVALICAVIALILAMLAGCTQNKEPEVVDTITTEFATYYEMSDGTWQAEGHSYKYRLVISGRMPNAAADSTFVYLSNVESLPFERAYKAAGISSSKADYFDVEDAVLVDWTTE